MSDPAPQSGCTLEDLRRGMEVGFTSVNGKLDHLVEHIKRTDAEVTSLATRVSVLEKRIFTASGAAAIIGVATPYIAQALGG